MLIHNGDMDARGGFTLENKSRVEEEELGDDDDATVRTAATTSSIIEGGGILCMNRRQTWTFLVYLITLLPALIVSDIGPVLSLTGAVGGSCISYIGPGLVYLGVNGEEFLNKVGSWLERKGHDRDRAGAAAGDLPVAGDAAREMAVDLGRVSYDRIVAARKPPLYYLGLFPLWTSVAHAGATRMAKKTEAAASAAGAAKGPQEVLPPPSGWDFGVCFFFILFGVVSAVAGVGSNIYVQLNNLDEV